MLIRYSPLRADRANERPKKKLDNEVWLEIAAMQDLRDSGSRLSDFSRPQAIPRYSVGGIRILLARLRISTEAFATRDVISSSLG